MAESIKSVFSSFMFPRPAPAPPIPRSNTISSGHSNGTRGGRSFPFTHKKGLSEASILPSGELTYNHYAALKARIPAAGQSSPDLSSTENNNAGFSTIIKRGWLGLQRGSLKNFSLTPKVWMVLEDRALHACPKEDAMPIDTMPLSSVIRLERLDVRKFGFAITSNVTTWYLVFKDITSFEEWFHTLRIRCPLLHISHPTGFEHKMHVAYDRTAGEITGLPEAWITTLAAWGVQSSPTQSGFDDPPLPAMFDQMGSKNARTEWSNETEAAFDLTNADSTSTLNAKSGSVPPPPPPTTTTTTVGSSPATSVSRRSLPPIPQSSPTSPHQYQTSHVPPPPPHFVKSGPQSRTQLLRSDQRVPSPIPIIQTIPSSSSSSLTASNKQENYVYLATASTSSTTPTSASSGRTPTTASTSSPITPPPTSMAATPSSASSKSHEGARFSPAQVRPTSQVHFELPSQGQRIADPSRPRTQESSLSHSTAPQQGGVRSSVTAPSVQVSVSTFRSSPQVFRDVDARDLTDHVQPSHLLPSNRNENCDIWKGEWTGGFGKRKVDIHVIRMPPLTPSSRIPTLKSLIYQEVKALHQLRHPHVVRIRGYVSDEDDRYGWGPLPGIVETWIPCGNVVEWVEYKRPVVGKIERLRVLTEAAAGLNYLHSFSREIIHGNFRGMHILLNERNVACVSGYGVNPVLCEMEFDAYAVAAEISPAPRWASIEAFTKGRKALTAASDVWSFARTVLEVLTGRHPFEYITDDAEVIPFVLRNILPRRPPVFSTPGLASTPKQQDSLWAFLERCWAEDPSKRPSMALVLMRMEDAVNHAKRCGDDDACVPAPKTMSG